MNHFFLRFFKESEYVVQLHYNYKITSKFENRKNIIGQVTYKKMENDWSPQTLKNSCFWYDLYVATSLSWATKMPLYLKSSIVKLKCDNKLPFDQMLSIFLDNQLVIEIILHVIPLIIPNWEFPRIISFVFV